MKAQKNTLIIVGIIAVVAASRLLPDSIANFTAIGAIAFMGGALFKNKWLKYLLPLAILALSDLALNTFVYSEFTNGSIFYKGMLWVYLPFIVSVFLGEKMLKNIKVSNVLLTALASGIVFFLLSNFGVWLSGTIYPKTGAGLIEAYTMGIPFFRSTLLGNMVYGLVIFFAYQIATNSISKKSIAQ